MKPINMSNFRGRQKAGVDYSVALRDQLPLLIQDKAMSMREISNATDRNFETVRTIFAKLHGKQIYIAGWRRSAQGPIVALLRWGSQPDVPKPPPLTSAEKSSKYRASESGHATAKMSSIKWRQSERGKARQDAYNETRKARYRARIQAKKTAHAELKMRDPLLAAIMG